MTIGDRQVQEDNYGMCQTSEGFLAVLADGMGKGYGGKVALFRGDSLIPLSSGHTIESPMELTATEDWIYAISAGRVGTGFHAFSYWK